MPFRNRHGQHLFQIIKKQFHTPVVAVAYMGNFSSWVCESRPDVRAVARTERSCPRVNDVVHRNGRVV